MGYKPSNRVPIYICNFTVLFTKCMSREMELSKIWVVLKAGNMKKKEMLGRINKSFELKNLPAVPSGGGICFQELKLL